MEETAVKLALVLAIQEYDKQTAQPRHDKATDDFNELRSDIDKMWGGMKTLITCLSVPSMLAAVILIIRFFRGH